MVKTQKQLEAIAKKRVQALFRRDRVPTRRPLVDILDVFTKNRWTAFLFGGTVRDLMILKDSVPRDVDIVVDDVPTSDLLDAFQFCLKRQTRFGGLHLEWKGWLFDVWMRSSTWAFKSGEFSNTEEFFDLPRTTFLNVEAIVVEITDGFEGARRVFSHGFFDAMNHRVVEINFPENPFPALCIVRALISAKKLNYRIGPQLAQYIVGHLRTVSLEELLKIQEHHYGRIRLDRDELLSYLQVIQSGVSVANRRPIELPSWQRDLWDTLG